ncbi:copper-binding protein [Piscinibacter terrae]|uniref:RND transporter n=1 Tax=Piscinibacter terrae TaxID=2496871 RepID=A0A3N7JKH1_9BURK|nr:copper-binding protein [Albitalea terrae]RQP21809.1 RND transporter [Albitalea terrae]
MKVFKHTIALVILSVAAGSTFAAADTAEAAATVPTPVAQASTTVAATNADEALTRGVIKKIDTEQSKITIAHEALDNLGMPAMTMVFRAADAKLLQGAQAGQAIAFRAERLNGALVVTRLQPL